MKIYKISAKEPDGKYRMENTITEIKISLDRLNSGVAIKGDKMRELEDRKIEFIKFEQQRENSLRDFLVKNNKRSNVHIIRLPEGE